MNQNQSYYIQQKSNKHNLVGLAGTLIFHALIFICLYLFVLVPPNPPWEKQGMTMSLGEENMGGPDETPIENPQPTETYTPIETTTEKVEELSQETDEVDIVANKTDDKKDPKPKIIPPIEQPKKIKDQPKEQSKEIVELPRKADARSMFRRKNSTDDNGGRGSGDEPGNEGRPDGDPDGIPGGTGTGNSGLGSGSSDAGNGIKYSLGGRRIAKKPVISASSKDVGTVVVNITVDRAGNVIKAEPGAKNSTTLDLDKLQKAKQAALSTKFSPKPDGPEEQYGTMTVNFTFE